MATLNRMPVDGHDSLGSLRKCFMLSRKVRAVQFSTSFRRAKNYPSHRIDVSRELHQNQKLVRSQAKLHVTHTAGRLYGLRAVC